MSTLRLPHCEHTSRRCHSGTDVSHPYQRTCSAGSALGNDRISQNANPVDLDLNDVGRLHPEGRFCAKPTPSGVPVEITSSALSGIHCSQENHREKLF
jgi:hypothetical protein